MKSCFKHVIVWLMLVAMPLQGLAAATMMCCGPIHSSHDKKLTLAEETAIHHHVESDADLSDKHHEEGLAALDSDTAAQHQDGNGKSSRAAVKCGACSACSIGAAIPSSTKSAFAAIRFGSVQIAFVSRYFYRFVPESLERPPYRLIA